MLAAQGVSSTMPFFFLSIDRHSSCHKCSRRKNDVSQKKKGEAKYPLISYIPKSRSRFRLTYLRWCAVLLRILSKKKKKKKEINLCTRWFQMFNRNSSSTVLVKFFKLIRSEVLASGCREYWSWGQLSSPWKKKEEKPCCLCVVFVALNRPFEMLIELMNEVYNDEQLSGVESTPIVQHCPVGWPVWCQITRGKWKYRVGRLSVWAPRATSSRIPRGIASLSAAFSARMS